MNAFPFGLAVTYEALFQRLQLLGCSSEEMIKAGEIRDSDGAPCPSFYRIARTIGERVMEYPLTKYPEDKWVFPAVIQAIEQALEIDLSILN